MTRRHDPAIRTRGRGWLEDLALNLQTARNMGMMPGLSICGLPDGATYPIETVVKKFRGELEERIRAQAPEGAGMALAGGGLMHALL
ncbi:MAG: hypothetical protein FLDDKLPJ_01609 [Phycisphaerae bacterium]|nr:hypothetical protein [Phycisphaerae bacterium]